MPALGGNQFVLPLRQRTYTRAAAREIEITSTTNPRGRGAAVIAVIESARQDGV
jgi:hypothetical protein